MIAMIAFFISHAALAREVELSWEPFENALGYQVQVSKKSDFKTPLLQKNLKDPGLTTELEIGSYFYRVRAIDKDKQPGFWSEPMKFEVTPYPPELRLPKSESYYSFFEIPPKIEFEWKPVDGAPEYEIFIYRTTGKKALEKRTKDLKLVVDSLTEGEYMWKMRTIHRGVFESPYGEPRRFNIEKKELQPPTLKAPNQGEKKPAYRDVELEWKKDEVAKFTDLAVSYKSDETAEVIRLDPPKNREGTSWLLESAEPGLYKWRVKTKEGQDTKGVDSTVGEFEVRKDMIADDNWGFSYGLGYFTKSYEASSTKLTNGSGQFDASGFGSRVSAFNYLSQGVGFQIDGWHADLKQAEWSLAESGFHLSLRLRFGTPGFNQQFFFGFRQMNEYEILTSPSNAYNLHTTNGAIVGTTMSGSFAKRFRIALTAAYFKPLSTQERIGETVGDVYEGELGLHYNLRYRFWLGFSTLYQKSVYRNQTKDVPAAGRSSWESSRITPTLVLGFE
jgi:hypothetical protein